MKSSRPELVIFDCDGVLVDSEPISIAVLLETVRAAGRTIAEDVAYERFLGRSMASIREILSDEFDLAMGDEHLKALRASLHARFRSELKPIAGIAEALRDLGIARCVASSGQPERIRVALTVTGLIEFFEPHIFSASMVKRGKPEPDLFLHAARSMGAEPARCVVVEDSPAGIAAARAAGMRVLAFGGGSHAVAGRLHEAFQSLSPDAIFDDMRLLPQLLDPARIAS